MKLLLSQALLIRIGKRSKNWADTGKHWVGFVILPIMILLVALIVAGNTIFGVERTFLISVRTSGMDLQFAGNGNAWSFSRAQICKRLPQPKRASATVSSLPCDPRLFESAAPGSLILQWPENARLELRQGPDNNLVLHLLTDLPELPKGSLILIDHENWLNDGAFSFTGISRLGSDMASGTQRMVYEGRYEIRETSLISRLIKRRTNVIKDGVLIPGEAIRVVRAEDTSLSAPGFGHITVGEIGLWGFNAVFVSARGDHALEISSFGAPEPQLIFPDWVDSAISSPFLLALAFILSLLGGAVQLVMAIFRPPSDQK